MGLDVWTVKTNLALAYTAGNSRKNCYGCGNYSFLSFIKYGVKIFNFKKYSPLQIFSVVNLEYILCFGIWVLSRRLRDPAEAGDFGFY